jgi:4-amino-4-deoxy-L-arabinose transferase-like glycosyltransferase
MKPFGVPLRELLVVAFVLAVPPLVDQLARPAPRLDADAVEYFSHLRSLYFDHDLDFANEFEHFGLMTRWDKVQPTPTGHRRTIFSVGPALAWMPFYALGDLVARARGAVEDGYSPDHIRAAALGSLAYGVLGLLLVYGILRATFPRATAFWAVVLLEYATFLYWYMSREAVMSHAVSFCAAALVLAVWWPARRELTLVRTIALGLLIGLAAIVRWQNGVLLLLPAATLAAQLRGRVRDTIVAGVLTLAGFIVGVSPQLFAWKAIFGAYVLADPPHGRDFLRLGHPYLLETFFSSRHGLLYWTPLLWAGYLGFAGVWRRDRWTALALLGPLAVMSYVNACSGDWWAGGSFSNRRFDSLLPLLGLGLAAALAALGALVARRPALVLVACGVVLVAWNALFMQQYRENMIPRDETVSFPQVAGNNATLLARAVGTPLAWPANWVFARAHQLPASQYDRAVGQYLFYRQNNLGGVIDLGDPRVDPSLLDEGWSARAACEDVVCRGIDGRARVFAPLDVPEDLDVTLRVRGSGTLRVAVNGVEVTQSPLTPALADLRLRVPRAFWKRELNEIALGVDARAEVDKLVFVRIGARR